MTKKLNVQQINLKSSDAIDFLNEIFKDRSEDYQSKIDTMVSKIAILEYKEFINRFKYFFEINYIEMYSIIYSQDICDNAQDYTIVDKEKSYFMYKILLIYDEMGVIEKVNFKILHKSKHSYEFHEYINQILNISKFDNKLAQNSIKKLDQLASKINFLNYINTQGNVKSPSAVLLGLNKYKSFRLSKSNDISYDVKSIEKGYVKRLYCPACKAPESINIDNLQTMFKHKKAEIEYRCSHTKNELLYSKKVIFNIEPYIKDINSKKINFIDFALWNWKFLCSEFVINE
ncbi:MAG: hypothetical protein DRG78_07510 [Epsilonproteobacteria bacterium]|nr:MAG: hypothetical protein DRG78_07510 [Campylobacterota bacterium]